MFKYQIIIYPLGMLYGSSGPFLSPENLVGRSGLKFPPNAATVGGLFFSSNYYKSETEKQELRRNLFVAGPFWAKEENPEQVYVPIPWSLIVTSEGKECDRWTVKAKESKPGEEELIWERKRPDLKDIKPELDWQVIDYWNQPYRKTDISLIQDSARKRPWNVTPILHPKIREEQRSVVSKDGLFLESAVQLEPETCLTYLSSYPLEPGWYRFGGENHIVEIDCIELKGYFLDLLQQPIRRAFALITPGLWGSNRFSYRYPQNWPFGEPSLMLTDKPIPNRYRTGGSLGKGRYAVPAGSVYILKEPLEEKYATWTKWDESWFPKGNGPLTMKNFGSGLCLPIEIPGLSNSS